MGEKDISDNQAYGDSVKKKTFMIIADVYISSSPEIGVHTGSQVLQATTEIKQPGFALTIICIVLRRQSRYGFNGACGHTVAYNFACVWAHALAFIMDEDDNQQFSLRWHNHQPTVLTSLSRMLSSGALADVTLSASGTSMKAHRLVLASCSQYFAQLFKELETESGALVVVLGCEATELRLLLTFMYTGEVTASRRVLPSLLRLAQALKVSGLTDADTNSTLTPAEHEDKPDLIDQTYEPYNSPIRTASPDTPSCDGSTKPYDTMLPMGKYYEMTSTASMSDLMTSERDRLSKLDQIVQNLYSTHKIVTPGTSGPVTPPSPSLTESGDAWRGCVCGVCHKRLSNRYNLRVHMETHAGARHRCHACAHVSRSRDALRKHVAYRHPPAPAPAPAPHGLARL